MKYTKREVEESKKALRDIFKQPMQEKLIYTSLDNVSRSGMTRHISCYIARVDKNLESKTFGKAYIQDITWHIGRILGYPPAKNKGLIVGGCGMDMGFHVVYSTSTTLYGLKGGYDITQRWI